MRSLVRLLGLAAACLLLACAGDDASDCPQGFRKSGDACLQELPEAQQAELHGTVTTFWDGDAAGTRVRIAGAAAETTVGLDGTFAIVHDEQGPFTVRVERAGYLPLEIADVALSFGEPRDLGELALRAETGGIAGSLRLADGASPRGTLIYVAGTQHATAVDADGVFSLERLGPGAVTLVAMREGYAPIELAMTVVASEIHDGGVLVLERRAAEGVGRLAGAARLLGARDHAGITVRIAGGPDFERTTVTAADGSYSFERVPSGVYAIEATREGLEPARVEGLVIADGGLVAPALVLKASRRVHEQALVRGNPLPGGGALLELSPSLALVDASTGALAVAVPEGAEAVSLNGAGTHAMVGRAGTWFGLDLRTGATSAVFPEPLQVLAAVDGKLLYNAFSGGAYVADAATATARAVPVPGCAPLAPDAIEVVDPATPHLLHALVTPCFGDPSRYLIDLRLGTVTSAPGTWEMLPAGVLYTDAGTARFYDAAAGSSTVLTQATFAEWRGQARVFSHSRFGSDVHAVTVLDPATGAHATEDGIAGVSPLSSGEVMVRTPEFDVSVLGSGGLTPFCAQASVLLTSSFGDSWCQSGSGELVRRDGAGAITVAVASGVSDLRMWGNSSVITFEHSFQLRAYSVADPLLRLHDVAVAAFAEVLVVSSDWRYMILRTITATSGEYALVFVDFAAGDSTPQPFFTTTTYELPDECAISPQARTAFCVYPRGTASPGRLGVVLDRVAGVTHVVDAGDAHTARYLPLAWSPDERAALRTVTDGGLALRPTPTGYAIEEPAFASRASWAYAVSDEYRRALVQLRGAGYVMIDLVGGSEQGIPGVPQGRFGSGDHWIAGTVHIDLATGARASLGAGGVSVEPISRETAIAFVSSGRAHLITDAVEPIGEGVRSLGVSGEDRLLVADWNGRSGRLVLAGAAGVRTIAEDATAVLASDEQWLLVGTGLDESGRAALVAVPRAGGAIVPLGEGVPVGDPIERYSAGWLFNAREDGADVLLHVSDAGARTVMAPRASWIEVGTDGALSFAADGVWWVAAPGGQPVAVDTLEVALPERAVRVRDALLYDSAAGGTWQADLR